MDGWMQYSGQSAGLLQNEEIGQNGSDQYLVAAR